MRASIALPLVVASLAGCTAAVDSAGDAAGCYELAIGTWKPPLLAAGHGVHPLPSAIRLESTPARDAALEQWYALRPNADWREPRVLIGKPQWRLAATDSLEILWLGGLLRYEAGLRRTGGAWEGQVRFVTDVEPSPQPVAALTARPVRCSDAISATTPRHPEAAG